MLLLTPDVIVEPAKFTTSKTGIVNLQKDLTLKEEMVFFKAVHDLLVAIGHSSLGLRDTDTFVQQHKLENRKAHILRFLWILANYGRFEEENGGHLVVDAETYEANRGKEKTLAIWSSVADVVFKILAEFGVCCERIALNGAKNEELTTGTGYLQKSGWEIRLSFEERIGGANVLRAMQS